MKQAKRQKKSDRLIHGAAEKDAIICDFAVAPVDRLALEMDEKWGVDRLVELVSVETAAKFGSAMAKMNDAISANDVEGCKLRCEVVLRGLRAMDAEAERLGAQRASQDVWEVDVNGKVYAIMKDGRSWRSIREQRPNVELLTLREVALAYEFWRANRVGQFEEAVKQSFPEAEVSDVYASPLDDEIPF